MQHKLLVAVIVIVLLGVGWYEFNTSSAPPPAITTTGIGATATDTEDAQLVSTLIQLQAVTLSGTILSDPGFLSLQDFTTQVTSEPVGRPNPFASISPGIPVATSTQKINPNLFAPKSANQ